MIENLKAALAKLDSYGHGSISGSVVQPNGQLNSQPITAAPTKLIALALSVALIVYLALLNPLGFTPDYAPYIAAFDWARQASWSEMFPNHYRWEPGFMALAFVLSKAIATSGLAFLSMVLLASSVKLGLLYRIASPIAFVLAMVLFFFKYFPLLDYNQLRGAISISFLMLVYYQWVWKDNLKLALLFSVCALSFHYLSLALLPFVFLVKHPSSLSKSRVIIFALLLLCVLALIDFFIVGYLATALPRLGSYVAMGFKPAVSSYLSPVFFPEFFLILVSLALWGDCTNNMKRAVTLQLAGFSIFYGLFEYGVIGARLREVISVFWLFYLADYSQTTPRLRLATLVFVLMNIALGSYLFYFSGYFRYP